MACVYRATRFRAPLRFGRFGVPPTAPPPLPPGGPADHASRRPAGRRAQPEAPGRSAAPFGRRGQPCGAGRPPRDRARPAHAHGLASTATLCGGIGTVGALWILLALLGFLPTVGGTNPVRFESDSILGMRIQSHWLPTTGQYLAYQRDTYTNVTGRDLQLEAGRTTSLFKTMTETLDLARTNIASGVKEDDLKPIQRPAKRTTSPTDVAQTYMHDPAMTNTTALTKGPRYGRCRCTPCTDMSVGAQRPHPLPRCVSECYTFSAPYTEVPTTCPHRHLGYSRDVHTGGARE